MDYLLLFVAGFAQVFAMGFQSRNVNSGQYVLASVFSFGIGMSQGFVWSIVAPAGGFSTAALVYSLSGALAIVCAMWTHRRFVTREKGR